MGILFRKNLHFMKMGIYYFFKNDNNVFLQWYFEFRYCF